MTQPIPEKDHTMTITLRAETVELLRDRTPFDFNPKVVRDNGDGTFNLDLPQNLAQSFMRGRREGEEYDDFISRLLNTRIEPLSEEELERRCCVLAERWKAERDEALGDINGSDATAITTGAMLGLCEEEFKRTIISGRPTIISTFMDALNELALKTVLDAAISLGRRS